MINVKIFYSWIIIIFSKFIFIFCLTSTMNFKYLIIWRSNSHLLILTYKSKICNFVKTFCTWFQCSDKKSSVYMNILFKYVKTNSSKYIHRIQLILEWPSDRIGSSFFLPIRQKIKMNPTRFDEKSENFIQSNSF